MKRIHMHAIGICLTVTLTIGCKSEYPHIEYEGELDEVTYDKIESPVPIIVAVNDPIYVSYTRGVGVFDDLDEGDRSNYEKWLDADFYVYAFYSPNGIPGTPQSAADYKPSMNSNSENEDVPPFCLVDDGDPSTGHGRKARLDENKESFLHWEDEAKIYYSKIHQQCRYKFFAYYLDDAATTSDGTLRRPERFSDRVTYDVKIDGTQDLMCGYAEPTAPQIDNLLNAGERDIVNNIDALAYSTVTGNRDLFPIFTMKHQLVFLKFYIKKGSVNGEVDPTAAQVEIKNISIKALTEGKLTVAAEDRTKMGATFSGGITTLYMPVKHDDGTVVAGTAEGFNPVVSPEADKKEIGAGFLVPEAESYELTLYCHPKESGLKDYKVTYNLNRENDSFKAGHKYEVTIHVYGHQEIKLGLDNVTWIEGESIDVDDEVEDGDYDMKYDYD